MVAPGVAHNEGISVAQSGCEWGERGSIECWREESGGKGEVFKSMKGIKISDAFGQREGDRLFTSAASSSPLRTASKCR